MRMTWIDVVGAAVVLVLYGAKVVNDRGTTPNSAGEKPAQIIERPASPPSY
jgi:hypothetical protein